MGGGTYRSNASRRQGLAVSCSFSTLRRWAQSCTGQLRCKQSFVLSRPSSSRRFNAPEVISHCEHFHLRTSNGHNLGLSLLYSSPSQSPNRPSCPYNQPPPRPRIIPAPKFMNSSTEKNKPAITRPLPPTTKNHETWPPLSATPNSPSNRDLCPRASTRVDAQRSAMPSRP